MIDLTTLKDVELDDLYADILAEKERREYESKPNRLYYFAGTWGWRCVAKSEDEAFKKFHNANANDFNFETDNVWSNTMDSYADGL